MPFDGPTLAEVMRMPRRDFYAYQRTLPALRTLAARLSPVPTRGRLRERCSNGHTYDNTTTRLDTRGKRICRICRP